MNKRKHLLIPLILLGALLLAGCGGSKNGSFPEASAYSGQQLLLGSVNRFAGVVTASEETKIEKDASRTVASIAVSAGDVVKSGQVLFTYDGSQAQNNYDRALIELQQMQLSLESYTQQKAELEAEKASASADAQLEYTIQIQEVDTTIRETSYNINQKQKEVDSLAGGLEKLEVTAPADGKIQSVNAEGGTDQNGNELPFMVLVRTDAYRVKGLISEENIQDLNAGDPVLIRSRISDETWTGTVTSVDFENPSQSQNSFYGTTDAETATSSKYPFYVELDSSKGLMLGQHVFVEKAGGGEIFEEEFPEAESEVIE